MYALNIYNVIESINILHTQNQHNNFFMYFEV
jgi:hypothetical protein